MRNLDELILALHVHPDELLVQCRSNFVLVLPLKLRCNLQSESRIGILTMQVYNRLDHSVEASKLPRDKGILLASGILYPQFGCKAWEVISSRSCDVSKSEELEE